MLATGYDFKIVYKYCGQLSDMGGSPSKGEITVTS